MKLMIIILKDSDGDAAVQELVQNQFRVTRMASTGGFLRRGNSTLLVGVEDAQVEQVTGLLKRACQSAEEGHANRATIFTVDMAFSTKI